jgi:hypothetical protein
MHNLRTTTKICSCIMAPIRNRELEIYKDSIFANCYLDIAHSLFKDTW